MRSLILSCLMRSASRCQTSLFSYILQTADLLFSILLALWLYFCSFACLSTLLRSPPHALTPTRSPPHTLTLSPPPPDVIKLQLVDAGLVECLLDVVAHTVDGEREEEVAQLKTASDLMVLLLLGGIHIHHTQTAHSCQ